MSKQNIIAIIPARVGSQRLPKKNFLPFEGRSLTQRAVDQAIESEAFNQVVVSTDLPNANDHFSGTGATIHQRSEYAASDSASVLDVCEDVLKSCEQSFDLICVMLPTTPLRTVEDIQGCVDLLHKNEYDSVVAVSEFFFPVGYAMTMNKNGIVKREFASEGNLPTQSHGVRVVDNGALYILTREMLDKRQYFSSSTGGYLMPRWRSIDVDNYEDYQMALAFHNHRDHLP